MTAALVLLVVGLAVAGVFYYLSLGKGRQAAPPPKPAWPSAKAPAAEASPPAEPPKPERKAVFFKRYEPK